MTLALLLASLLAFQSNAGMIDGTVTQLGTGEGLAGVLITITKTAQPNPSREPDAVTDSAGRFTIRNAAPGGYIIQAARRGYLPPMKDGVELEEGGSKRRITVEPGKPQTVALTLSPGGVMAGRVVDPLGRPADGATVEALLVSPSGATKRSGSATVDERGQYRIWGLAPGKYKLSVEYTSAGYTISVTGVLLSLGDGRPLYVPETWAKTYFPGTPDADRAAIVEVREGAAVERLDFGISNRR
jgi:hypothetical protein